MGRSYTSDTGLSSGHSPFNLAPHFVNTKPLAIKLKGNSMMKFKKNLS